MGSKRVDKQLMKEAVINTSRKFNIMCTRDEVTTALLDEYERLYSISRNKGGAVIHVRKYRQNPVMCCGQFLNILSTQPGWVRNIVKGRTEWRNINEE
tara:strand:- start:357 stop:650 length:294 start_codon:yes stop_codon:yes gene_type:complete